MEHLPQKSKYFISIILSNTKCFKGIKRHYNGVMGKGFFFKHKSVFSYTSVLGAQKNCLIEISLIGTVCKAFDSATCMQTQDHGHGIQRGRGDLADFQAAVLLL